MEINSVINKVKRESLGFVMEAKNGVLLFRGMMLMDNKYISIYFLYLSLTGIYKIFVLIAGTQ